MTRSGVAIASRQQASSISTTLILPETGMTSIQTDVSYNGNCGYSLDELRLLMFVLSGSTSFMW